MAVLVLVWGSLWVLVRVWVEDEEGGPCECGCAGVEGGAPEWEVGGHFESEFVLMVLDWRMGFFSGVFCFVGEVDEWCCVVG